MSNVYVKFKRSSGEGHWVRVHLFISIKKKSIEPPVVISQTGVKELKTKNQ